jgi:hypothetical protein
LSGARRFKTCGSKATRAVSPTGVQTLTTSFLFPFVFVLILSPYSYLLELVTALPNLKTLDSMSDIQLLQFTDKLRSGAITQDAALAMSSPRPSTPASYRPLTPLSRPGSSSGVKSRPMTPTTMRPGTSEAPAPVFHQPSARMGKSIFDHYRQERQQFSLVCVRYCAAGTLQKLPDPLEIARKHDDVSNRLREMKAMLQRVGTPDSDMGRADSDIDNERQKRRESRASKSAANCGEAKRENRGDLSASTSDESKRSRGPETDMVLAARDIHDQETTDVNEVEGQPKSKSNTGEVESEPSSRQRSTKKFSSQRPARSVGVDAGTDPMDSYTPSVLHPTTSHGDLPLPLTASSHHEMETQTAPPPGAPIAVSTGEDRSSIVDGANVPWEPEFDGLMLEKEMKSFLLQQAKLGEQEDGGDTDSGGSGFGDNQADADSTQATESPRLEAVKSAELRHPPTARSRQGYRAFRMPSEPISPNIVS